MTPNMTAVLRFIAHTWREFGHGPSYAEITEVMGWNSRSIAHAVVQRLIQHGWVKKTNGSYRSIEPTARGWGHVMADDGEGEISRLRRAVEHAAWAEREGMAPDDVIQALPPPRLAPTNWSDVVMDLVKREETG